MVYKIERWFQLRHNLAMIFLKPPLTDLYLAEMAFSKYTLFLNWRRHLDESVYLSDVWFSIKQTGFPLNIICGQYPQFAFMCTYRNFRWRRWGSSHAGPSAQQGVILVGAKCVRPAEHTLLGHYFAKILEGIVIGFWILA